MLLLSFPTARGSESLEYVRVSDLLEVVEVVDKVRNTCL